MNDPKEIAEGQWPLCEECGEWRATDVDGLCDFCGDYPVFAVRREPERTER